jgi:hypothetical protein
MVLLAFGGGGGEELAVVEAVGLEHGPAAGVVPVRPGAVVVELDAVAVGVVEVDRHGAAVVGAVVRVDAVVEQPLHGLAELGAVGVHERDVVEAGVAGRRRRRARALPRVQADVVVVVAGRQEHGVDSGLAAVGLDLEPERVAVERERAIQIGDPEMHVADPHGGVDGVGLHGRKCPRPTDPRHRYFHLTHLKGLSL